MTLFTSDLTSEPYDFNEDRKALDAEAQWLEDSADIDTWDLTEQDGFPIDYVWMDGTLIDIDEDCDDDCLSTGFCICSL